MWVKETSAPEAGHRGLSEVLEFLKENDVHSTAVVCCIFNLSQPTPSQEMSLWRLAMTHLKKAETWA